jgi:protein-disulfide isomerase
MQNILDRVLTVLLVVAALAIASVLVHREFLAPAPASPARQSEYVPAWRDMIPSGHMLGDTGAAVTIIEFTDIECPFCRAFHGTLRSVMRKYPDDVSFVFVHRPLAGHRFARPAARASECAHMSGKFVEMVDALFEAQDSLGLAPWTQYARRAGIGDTVRFARCMADTAAVPAIEAGVSLAERMSVTATPTVILSGWRYGSPPSETELTRAIDDLIAGRKPYPKFPAEANHSR